MGVGDDFLKFRASYNIDRDTISSISRRYRRITAQLNWDFWGTISDVAHSLYVGSYGRDTAAYGLSDLDIGFILPYDTYVQYNGRANNGQSALLQAVKRSIQNTYRTSESFGDGQVVVINFTDGITFEVLPAFLNKDGSWTFPNANAGGYWRVCNPRGESSEIKAVSDATNHNLKYLCRMMRVWRDYHSVPISGMLIDTLAYRFILGWAYRDKSFAYHDYMARDFFQYLVRQNRSQSYWLAPGSNSQVRRTGIFESKAQAAYRLALQAIDADTAGYDWRRRDTWRKIFCPRFPS